jgi:hypothetical protein
MDIFLRFEVWNVLTNKLEPMSNMRVDLMDSNRVVSDTLMETGTTDSSGSLRFSLTEADLKQKSGEDKPDLYFKARPREMSFGGTTLPAEWSTKPWKDKNGKPGYFPNTAFVAGSSLAGSSAADPLVYRIGLDYHARFLYADPKDSSSRRAPKGLRVGFRATSNKNKIVWQRTDAEGEVHGVTFDADAGADMDFVVEFNIMDPAINLPESTADTDGPNNVWVTICNDKDSHYFPDNKSTSIGTQAAPELISCSTSGRNVAMFFLTMLYEHATFFYYITDGAWTGISDLNISKHGFGSGAYSWPVGSVNLTEDWWGDRATLIHELSHQVMWKEVGISSLNIVGMIAEPQGLCMEHYENMVASWTHAVIEGWAEIFEGIFEPSSMTLTGSSMVRDGKRSVPLGPTPVNQGLKVEGAFAQAMIGIFHNYVVGSASPTPSVPRSVNGDVTQTAPWIKDPGVKARFKSAIWEPLHAVRSGEPWTTDFVNQLQVSNPAAWPDMLIKLNEYNIATDAPKIDSISPASGPATGGQAITITGNFFHPGQTTVTIGAKPATAVVSTPRQISCQSPDGGPAKVDVVVTTSTGSATLDKGYEFLSVVPTISSVDPASGPQAGGQHIRIFGTNFDPAGTSVTIGEVPAALLSAPGDDPTTVINCVTPGGTRGLANIVVTTGAGSAALLQGYEYL